MVDFERKDRYTYEDLLQVVHILRSPGGCPWDQEQTHRSIRLRDEPVHRQRAGHRHAA